MGGGGFQMPQTGQFICSRPCFHPQSSFISPDFTVTLYTQLVCDEDDPVSDVTDVAAAVIERVFRAACNYGGISCNKDIGSPRLMEMIGW